HYVDIVGVTGSIPVAPTIKIKVLEAFFNSRPEFGSTWEAAGDFAPYFLPSGLAETLRVTHSIPADPPSRRLGRIAKGWTRAAHRTGRPYANRRAPSRRFVYLWQPPEAVIR